MSVAGSSLLLFSFFDACDILVHMNYFALQVKTSAENKFIRIATSTAFPGDQDAVRLLFPRKMLHIRKLGMTHKTCTPIFPGYLFLETALDPEAFYWKLRSVPGFYRYLPDNRSIKPMEGRDLATLKHFVSFGPVAESSTVTFDENDRIHVDAGPLKGLEGMIVKVDKRKRRARVKLDMYSDSFLVDLAFTLLEHS